MLNEKSNRTIQTVQGRPHKYRRTHLEFYASKLAFHRLQYSNRFMRLSRAHALALNFPEACDASHI